MSNLDYFPAGSEAPQSRPSHFTTQNGLTVTCDAPACSCNERAEIDDAVDQWLLLAARVKTAPRQEQDRMRTEFEDVHAHLLSLFPDPYEGRRP